MREKTIPLKAAPSPRFLKINKILAEVIVAILLIVWLHTSISKLLDFSGLKIQMSQSLVFSKMATLAAITGPSLEILLSILLIFKKSRMIGLIGSFLLMLFFTWYVIYLMSAMPNLPCACGGMVNFLTWPQHLVLNITLTLLSLIGILLWKNQKKFEHK